MSQLQKQKLEISNCYCSTANKLAAAMVGLSVRFACVLLFACIAMVER